jgi:hypothetical protein
MLASIHRGAPVPHANDAGDRARSSLVALPAYDAAVHDFIEPLIGGPELGELPLHVIPRSVLAVLARLHAPDDAE